jgi:hypothetical protein
MNLEAIDRVSLIYLETFIKFERPPLFFAFVCISHFGAQLCHDAIARHTVLSLLAAAVALVAVLRWLMALAQVQIDPLQWLKVQCTDEAELARRVHFVRSFRAALWHRFSSFRDGVVGLHNANLSQFTLCTVLLCAPLFCVGYVLPTFRLVQALVHAASFVPLVLIHPEAKRWQAALRQWTLAALAGASARGDSAQEPHQEQPILRRNRQPQPSSTASAREQPMPHKEAPLFEAAAETEDREYTRDYDLPDCQATAPPLSSDDLADILAALGPDERAATLAQFGLTESSLRRRGGGGGHHHSSKTL